MARSKEEIEIALRASLNKINDTLDYVVGPIWNYLLSPIPKELALVEEEIERLLRFYSIDFASVATFKESLTFANNFNLGLDFGGFASVKLVFFRSTAPQATLNFTIPLGTIVSTKDQLLTYRTTEAVTMFGSFASSFFNPTTNRYEIEVNVKATSPGQTYNVPAGRITTIITTIDGFNGVDQRVQADGGSESESSFDLVARVQNKFLGLDINSIGGIERIAVETNPTLIRFARIIRPTDRREFRRLVGGPALDLYISGEQPSSFNESHLAVGGESNLSLTTSAALSLTAVTVNLVNLGVADFVFIPDTSLELQGSSRAEHSVQFTNPLTVGDLVTISGIKNSLISTTQLVFSGRDNALFKTDILVRSFVELDIIIGMDVKISSGDPPSVLAGINAFITDLIEPDLVPIVLSPSIFADFIKIAIPNVDTVTLYEFRRKQGSIQAVEFITPLKNQRPIYNQILSSIVVRL